MFGPNKPPAASAGTKPNGLDVLIQKLSALPPAFDLMIAAALSAYSLVAIFVDNAKLVGLVCILLALIFAMLGISSITREMKAYKLVESSSTPDILRRMKTTQFEHYLAALFTLDGYRLRSAIDELHRQDDADFIATKKKEVLLIQFNHWDEDIVGIKSIQSLQKAAMVSHATGCVAIGCFSAEAVDWAGRKGVVLMSMDDVIATACRLTGKTVAEAHPAPPPEVQEEQQHEIAEIVRGHHRFLFVDFSGLDHGLTRLTEMLLEHPAYQVLASTLPFGKTLDDIRAGLNECGDRLIGEVPTSAVDDNRYFAIQNYLLTTPEGKHATWLAIDTEPRKFPEGCSELVAVNPAFGFDSSAAQRLLDAMLLVDKRVTAGVQPTSQYLAPMPHQPSASFR